MAKTDQTESNDKAKGETESTEGQPWKAPRGYWQRPVEFGSVAVGAKGVGIGVKVDLPAYGHCSALADLNKLRTELCDSRLTAIMRCDPLADGDDGGQATLVDTSTELDAIAEVSRISVGLDDIGLRLTFSEADVAVEELAKFHNRSGVLAVRRVARRGSADG
jgi:hypothetical protein